MAERLSSHVRFWLCWALMSGIFVTGSALLTGRLTVFEVVVGVLFALPVALVAGWLSSRS